MPSPYTEFEDLTAPVRAHTFEGIDAPTLARRLELPRVELFERVTSTLDVAHQLARDGAPAGTLVVAEEQTAGRGRGGRIWRSRAGAGIWMTLIERPSDATAVEVLSLRIGIHAAPALDRFTDEPVSLKWPNDLLVGSRKLAGVLIEARWRANRPDWVAIGFGINVLEAGEPGAVAVSAGSSRLVLLEVVVAAIRRAASARGQLTGAELEAFAARDMTEGRRVAQPVAGIARGINSHGALLIERSGATVIVREGSLVLENS